MTIVAECAPTLSSGNGPLGERRHIQIVGGHAHGPGLKAKILPGGSDWAQVRGDRQLIVSAHYSLLTEDGIPIYVQNRGLRIATPEVATRIASGDLVDADAYYFRSSPLFEAPYGRLEYLNDRIFTARCERKLNVTNIHVFEVC